MKYAIAVLVLCFASAFAQDAKVVELSKEESILGKHLYEAKQKADKDWDDFYRYTRDNNGFHFTSEIEFSSDFRFVVPKSNPFTGGGVAWNNGCGWVTTPASGTITLGTTDSNSALHEFDQHGVQIK